MSNKTIWDNRFLDFEMSPKDMADDLYTDGRFLLSMPNRPLGDYKDHCAIEFAKHTTNKVIEALEGIQMNDTMQENSISWNFVNLNIEYQKEVYKEIEKIKV